MSNCNCNPCQPKKCKPKQCGCPVLISSDCVNDVKTVFTNYNIPTGLSLTQTLQLMDEAYGVGSGLINVGDGVPIYKGLNLAGKSQLHTLTNEGDLIEINLVGNVIQFSINEAELTNFINEVTPIKPDICLTSEDESVSITEKDGCFDLSVESNFCVTSSKESISVEQSEGCFDIDISLVQGDNVVINKVGTTYTFSSPLVNPQKSITLANNQSYTLLSTDNFHTIFVTVNGANSTATITVPTGLPNNFTVSFFLITSGDATLNFVNASGVTIKVISGYEQEINGDANWAMLEKQVASETYFLAGNLTETP
jgi:hypothetical protein